MINFPDTPTLNQVHTVAGGGSWKWDGVKWVVSRGVVVALPAPTMITVTTTQTLTTGFNGFVKVQNTAPITITMPLTPTTGQLITIKDTLGNAGTQYITIAGGTSPIEGASTFRLMTNYSWAELIYDGAKWVRT